MSRSYGERCLSQFRRRRQSDLGDGLAVHQLWRYYGRDDASKPLSATTPASISKSRCGSIEKGFWDGDDAKESCNVAEFATSRGGYAMSIFLVGQATGKARNATGESPVPGKMVAGTPGGNSLWKDRRYLWCAGWVTLLLLVTGCATPRDLEELRSDVRAQVTASQSRMDSELGTTKNQLDAVARKVGSLEEKVDELRTIQQASVAEVRQDMKVAIEDFQQQVAALEKVRQQLEDVRTDVALLKPLGMALDSVQERIEATQGIVESLKQEAQTHQTSIAQLAGDVQAVHDAQAKITQETERLSLVVKEVGEGVIERLRMEMNFARDRVKQLEQVLNQYPRPERQEGPTISTTPPPGLASGGD